jgi:hypothetical protein
MCQLGHSRVSIVHKIDDGSDKKYTEDGSLVGRPRKRKPPSATNSLDGNELRDMLVQRRDADAPSVPLEVYSPAESPKRCAPPKSTKSLDGHEFTSQLGRNQVSSHDKIDEGGEKRDTVSNAPASVEVKDFPAAA